MSVSEELYERAIKHLPASDRLRLATRILNDLRPESFIDCSDDSSAENVREVSQLPPEQALPLLHIGARARNIPGRVSPSPHLSLSHIPCTAVPLVSATALSTLPRAPRARMAPRASSIPQNVLLGATSRPPAPGPSQSTGHGPGVAGRPKQARAAEPAVLGSEPIVQVSPHQSESSLS